MIVKIFSYFVFCMIIIAIYFLFSVKDKVANLHYQLRTVSKQINNENDTIHILKAELSYLTSPSRLTRLASNYLKLETIHNTQMIKDPLAPASKDYARAQHVNTYLIQPNIKWRYKKITNNKYIQTISNQKLKEYVIEK